MHFAETGAVVGGVERYLQALLAADVPDLEHAVVTHAGHCEYAGRWPAVTWPWLAPRTGATAGPAVSDAIPVFHAPPSPAALADLGRAPFAVFVHDHRWYCPSGTRLYLRTERPCDIRAGTGACGLRYHFLRCGSLRPATTLNGFVRAAVGRETLAQAAAVLCASDFMARQAVRHGAAADRVHVVPLPVAVPAGEPPPPAGTPVILSASRLTPEKGVRQLLDAFALVRTPARLVLLGDGILEARLLDEVAAHPARDRITLTGRLTGENLGAAFRAASAVATPSLWPEPFGLVGVEALALGRPVVSSGTGGSAEWSREELGVLTADPSDAAAFAAALDRVLTEPAWRARAGTTGAAWVARHHGLPAHVAALTAALAPLAAPEAAA